MTPRRFLLFGGIILLGLAAAGFTVLGPGNPWLSSAFYLDNAENVAHLVLGVVALGVYFGLKDEKLVRWFVLLVGIIAALVTVLGFLSAGNPAPNVGIANLEMLDNVLHLVVAVWAFAVYFMKPKAMVPAAPMNNQQSAI